MENHEAQVTFTGKRVSRLNFFYQGDKLNKGDVINVPAFNLSGEDLILHVFAFIGQHLSVRGQGVFLTSCGSYGDALLRTVHGPQIGIVRLISGKFTDMNPSDKYFKNIQPDLYLQKLCADAIWNVNFSFAEYTRIVKGSYVTTARSFETYVNVVDKFSNYFMVPLIPEEFETIATYVVFKDLLRLGPIPLTLHKLTVSIFSSGAGSGFILWQGMTFTKALNIPFVVDFLNYAFAAIYNGAHPSDFFRVIIYKMLIKSEVRGPDDPVHKSRLMGQADMAGEGVSEFINRPILDRIHQMPWCGIGYSMWSSTIINALCALRHPLCARLNKFIKRPDKLVNTYDRCLFMMDISGQDVSFVPDYLVKLGGMLMSLYDWNNPDKKLVRLYKLLFTWSKANLNAKLVQWFGGTFVYFNGKSLSGDKLTSVIATLGQRFELILIWLCCFDKAGVEWYDKLDNILMVLYGDDNITSLPLDYLKYISTDGITPDIFIDQAKRIGRKLKDPVIVKPSKNHRDPFFSHIVDDNLILEGANFLKHYFVKVDDKNNFFAS